MGWHGIGKPETPPSPLLKIGAVAKMFGVSVSAIRLWEQKGVLVPYLIRKTGHRFYLRADCDKFFNTMKNPAYDGDTYVI